MKKILKDLYNRNWKPVAVVAACFALWMLVRDCFMNKMSGVAENMISQWR